LSLVYSLALDPLDPLDQELVLRSRSAH